MRRKVSPRMYLGLLAVAGVCTMGPGFGTAGTETERAASAAATGGAELTPTQQLWVNSFDAEKGGDYDKALEYTSLIVGNAGDYYLPNLRMGWLHYLKGDYQAAIDYYLKAAQLSPGAVSALQGVMNCANKLGDTDKENQVAKAVLLIDPMNYQANLRLAVLYYEKGNFSAAGSYYLKLLSLYPEDLQIASGLAWCYLNEGLPQEAAAIFGNVLAVSPNYLQAKSGLALCAQTGNTRAASMTDGTKGVR